MGFSMLDGRGFRAQKLYRPDQVPALTIDDVLRCCGWPTALEFTRHADGRAFQVPVEHTMVIAIFGGDRALRLVQKFGGQWIDVPEGSYEALLKRRNAELREDHRRGLTMTQLKAKYEATERQVLTITRQVEG